MTETGTCAACRTTRPLDELLIVRDRHDASRPPWNLCRPQTPGRPYGECLRVAAPSAADYSIALAALPEPPPTPEVEVARARTWIGKPWHEVEDDA